MDPTGRGRARGPAAAQRMARRATVSAVAVAATLPLAGCGLLGSGAGVPTPMTLTVSSSEFPQNTLPERFTCGAGPKATNPPLEWAGAPPGTKSLALIVDDHDAPITPFVYWIVFDIKPATSEITQGQLPAGARQAQNSVGKAAYDPPCPGPAGHQYRFTVYALDKDLDLSAGASLQSAWSEIAAATIDLGRKDVTATSPAH